MYKKNVQNYIKHVNFWPDLHNICGYHGNIQNDDHLIDIRKFSGEITEQILKVSDTESFHNFKKNFWRLCMSLIYFPS